MLAACGQYICYFIDDAVQLELSQPWLTGLLNVVRVASLLHVLYGYILFLAIILFVVYITGVSMKEFRGKVVLHGNQEIYVLFVCLFVFFVCLSVCLERFSNDCRNITNREPKKQRRRQKWQLHKSLISLVESEESARSFFQFLT